MHLHGSTDRHDFRFPPLDPSVTWLAPHSRVQDLDDDDEIGPPIRAFPVESAPLDRRLPSMTDTLFPVESSPRDRRKPSTTDALFPVESAAYERRLPSMTDTLFPMESAPYERRLPSMPDAFGCSSSSKPPSPPEPTREFPNILQLPSTNSDFDLLMRQRADLAREREEFEKEKMMLAREREDLERQREELARSRQTFNETIARFAIDKASTNKNAESAPAQSHHALGECMNFGVISDCCRVALGSMCSRFVSPANGESVQNRRREQYNQLQPVEEETIEDDRRTPEDDRRWPSVAWRTQSSEKGSFIPPLIRSMSNLSFKSARSTSRDTSLRDLSLGAVSPTLHTVSSVFRSARGRSRSKNRDFSPFVGKSEIHSLDVGPPEMPLQVFKKSVTEALAKVSLQLDLENPIISKMAQPVSSPQYNATIREELLRDHCGLREKMRMNFTPLTFRSLILGFGVVCHPLRETNVSKLLEIFENQWLIKVRPGANKLIDGRRIPDDYTPLQVYEYGKVGPYADGDAKLSLGTVMEEDRRNHKPAGEGVLWSQRIMELLEGLLSRLFEMEPPNEHETLKQYMARLSVEVNDWRGYWRDFYSNSRCRTEVLGFVVGKLVDQKMKGSVAMLFPAVMIDKVFVNSVEDVKGFLIDLRIAMRMLDLIL